MAKIYFNLVKSGSWSIEQVPTRWRSDVEALLAEDGE